METTTDSVREPSPKRARVDASGKVVVDDSLDEQALVVEKENAAASRTPTENPSEADVPADPGVTYDDDESVAPAEVTADVTSDDHNIDDEDASSADDADTSDDVALAFEGALRAHMADGHTLTEAVTLILGGAGDSMRSRAAISGLDLSAPVLRAIDSAPELQTKVSEVARLCAAVYRLAEDDVHDGMVAARATLDLGIESLEDVAKIVSKANNIVVLSGAGVSVSCGIPDFRSKGGVYDTVLERYGLSDPQAIFDLEEFKMDPTLFYSFAKDIMPSAAIQPSATHRFIRELDRRGKLLRNYSQNIDGLEQRAGISRERVVLCHGSFLTATCMGKACRATVPGSSIADDVAAGIVPQCSTCKKDKKSSEPHRTDNGEDDDNDSETLDQPAGDNSSVLKPDIVFFGESLPKSVGESLQHDVPKADLVLVLGTSLQVAPVARIPQQFDDEVPRMLVNRELIGYRFDVELLGNCDAVVAELCNVLGWTLDPDANPKLMNESASQTKEDDAQQQKALATESEGVEAASNDNGPGFTFKPPRRFVFPGAVESDEDEDDDNTADVANLGDEEKTSAAEEGGGSGGPQEEADLVDNSTVDGQGGNVAGLLDLAEDVSGDVSDDSRDPGPGIAALYDEMHPADTAAPTGGETAAKT